MRELTTKEQLMVLESIDWDETLKYKHGLCSTIAKRLLKLFNIVIPFLNIHDYIPLFNLENAAKFGAESELYWWGFKEEDYIKRRQFINWVIEELEKQLQNETINS